MFSLIHDYAFSSLVGVLKICNRLLLKQSACGVCVSHRCSGYNVTAVTSGFT